MATLPTPRSYSQILGDQIDAFLSRFGIPALKVGSPVLAFLEAAAQSDLRSSQDIFDLLNATSLDRASGVALDNLAADEDIVRIGESAASGKVTVTDSRYTKLSSVIYQGTAAPIVGSTSVNVADASSFPATGSVYLGRGTTNYEGPIAYTAKMNNGSYWSLTLSTSTQRYHNLGESVVVAQGGNRTISVGTLVQTPQGNASDAIQFAVLYAAVIPDGEVEVENVTVVAQQPGVVGNVPAGAISEFVTVPFTGAIVTNPLPYTNGTAAEDDSTFRERIRAIRKSRSKGTPLAIKTAVVGITATDENKRVASASLVRRKDQPSVLYIDDGTGYEEQMEGVALEPLVELATGGEKYFRLASQPPVMKAFAKSSLSAPFALSAGDLLTFKVGGVATTHTFDADEFQAIGNATAHEVVASINSNSELSWSARTSDSGTRVVIFAKVEENEDLELVAQDEENQDANEALGFPTGRADTLRLYKNDRLISKDGKTASLTSEPPAAWGTLASGDTLTVAVDGTGAVTYSFTDADFVSADTGYSTVGKNTVAAWAKVFEAKIPGLSAADSGGKLALTSNLTADARSRLQVTGGTLVSKGMFVAGDSEGAARDYTLNRHTGELELVTPLAEGDRLDVGTSQTRAFLESEEISPTTLSSTGKLYFLVDGAAQAVATSVTGATPLDVKVQTLYEWGNRVRIASSTGATLFSDVAIGDWVIAWDSAFSSGNRGYWRVSAKANNYVEFDRPNLNAARSNAAMVVLGNNKILLCGGYDAATNQYTATCELYDYSTGAWTPTGSMASPRAFHTATLLANGKVLVAGGRTSFTTVATDACELYDPTTGTWSATGSLPFPRSYGAAVRQANNKVLYAGGIDHNNNVVQTSYLYDQGTGTWAGPYNMNAPRVFHSLCLSGTDAPLVAGGSSDGVTPLASCELFDTTLTTWSLTGALGTARMHHSAILLTVGAPDVLVVGGTDAGASPLSSCERFNGAAWAGTGAMSSARTKLALVEMVDSNILAVGGDSGCATYDVAGGTWSNNDAMLAPNRTYPLAASVPITFQVLVAGGNYSGKSLASAETFNRLAAPGSQWTATGATVKQTSVSLSNNGLVFVRSPGQLQEISVAAGANYTAQTFATALSGLKGATASVYRTNKLRVSTNSYGEDGDIALVTADVEGQKLLLPVGDAVENLTSHLPSVEVLLPEHGTPNFKEQVVLTVGGSNTVGAALTGANSGQFFVGLRTNAHSASVPRHSKVTQFTSSQNNGVTASAAGLSTFSLRSLSELGPGNRFYLAAPPALGPQDSLSLVVDQDEVSKRFTVPMYRKLKPAGTTFGVSNDFKDADNSNASLAVAFGLSFDFKDFVAYMRARTKTHNATVKAILWRYQRFGSEGNQARLRYTYPDAASTALAVTTDFETNQYTSISVALPSGAARSSINVRNTTKVGLAITGPDGGGLYTYYYLLGYTISSGQRTTNVTTLTLSLPAGILDHGLAVNDSIYFASSSGSFTSGSYIITGRSATTISFADVGADTGAIGTPGTVSYDTQEATFVGSTVAVNDILRVNSSGTAFPGGYIGKTLACTTKDNQYVSGMSETNTGSGGVTASNSTPVWAYLNDTTAWSFYPIDTAAATITQIASSVNALASAADSTCPVKATVIGAGGTVTLSSYDEAATANTWFSFTDGVNYVKSSTAPGSVAGDYTLVFKDAITASLATDSDWVNEEIRLVPGTTDALVKWLNAPAVCGLYINTTVEAASQGRKLQLTSVTPGSRGSLLIQGGTANSLSVSVVGSAKRDGTNSYALALLKVADAASLTGGQWVALQNANKMPKAVFNASTQLDSIATDGTFTLNAGGSKAWTQIYQQSHSWLIEKQGRFVAFVNDPTGTNGAVNLSSVNEGDWVNIHTGTINVANTGLFRVVRKDGGTFWIENEDAVEETTTATCTFIQDDVSLLPGDSVVISTSLWGVNNQGTWTVESVGFDVTPYANQYKFKVVTTAKTPTTQGAVAALGASSSLVQAYEGTPSRLVKKVSSLTPYSSDGAYTWVKFDTDEGYQKISAAAGTLVQPLDKLELPTTLSQGLDGYSHATGLVAEANRVCYGVESDPATYPGVVAAPGNLAIAGPLVKRVKLSLALRVRSGISTTDISDRVKSALASVINQTGIGEPIALSALVSAATKINGVVAVTILSPSYSAGNDLIEVQPDEKPLVLDLDQDLLISFVGE